MIGILLVSHGKMAEGIKDSVEMIVGKTEQFETLALIPGQDVADLKQTIFDKSTELDQGDGILILVDLYGASPYNAAMQSLREWQKAGIDIRLITGMNLPMVITAVCNRDTSPLDALAKEAIEAGKENIHDAILDLITPQTESDDY